MSKTIEFERSLKKLEKIVQELEKGELSLDEALKKYEQGIDYAQDCSKKLKDARLKVETLAKKQEGKNSQAFSE